MSKDAVQGINYVRPPELKFTVKKETNNFTEYEIETFKNAKEQSSDNVFTRNIDTLIYCSDKFKIKVPFFGGSMNTVFFYKEKKIIELITSDNE